MKNMNFLPEPFLERKELNRFLKKAICLWAIAFFCVLLLVLCLGLTMSQTSKDLSDHNLRLQNPGYLVSDKLWEEAIMTKESLDKQQGLLETLAAKGLALTDIYRLIEALPEGIYAWELKLEDSAQRGEVQGVAEDQRAISDFVEYLTGNPYFQNVQLTQMRKTEGRSADFTVRFEW